MTAHFRLLLDRAVAFLADGLRSGAAGELQEQVGLFHVQLEALREMAKMLACEVLGRAELDGRLFERLLFLGDSLTEWWDRFVKFFERSSVPKEAPVTILLNDARLLRVNQRLRSLQTKRIAGSILAKRAI
jgi:hypothetical protein